MAHGMENDTVMDAKNKKTAKRRENVRVVRWGEEDPL